MPRRNSSRKRKPSSPVAREPAQPATPVVASEPEPGAASARVSGGAGIRLWRSGWLAAGLLLAIHYAIAVASLVRENPTIDEVVHLPAGVTYWQQGTFRLYHHNPPLVKLVAALPVVLAKPITEPLYQTAAWRSPDPSQTTFSQFFAALNVDRYFELFQSARLLMPLFSVIGGLAVFVWSRTLYGVWGGLLSLTLWVFCPNILAHGRLITTDMGATALGVAASYCFWRYLWDPRWRRVAAAGITLGLAQLTKFSMVLLLGVWPFLWFVWFMLVCPRDRAWNAVIRAFGHAVVMIGLCVLTIDAGYFFERVGIPLGQYEFGSRTLTRPVAGDTTRPRSKNPLLDAAWQFRINRFRGTWLGALPSPLPEHYLLGFDEQKIEAEGIPRRFFRAIPTGRVVAERAIPETASEAKDGYPVYLNGVLRRTGWWYYYLVALWSKLPLGTILLVFLSIDALFRCTPGRAGWANEIAVATVPIVILITMSFFTDINIGVRYVLPIFPYIFISAGKVAVAAKLHQGARRYLYLAFVATALVANMVSCYRIHPSYLAYFGWPTSPDQVPPVLIDSNLDWGQDLVGLHDWCQANIPGEPIGLAYFGQINPSMFTLRGHAFRWFLPPAPPGTIEPMVPGPRNPALIGPARKLTPGYYAVSVSLLYGLPWRLYDPADPRMVPEAWAPAWNAWDVDHHAFGYFRKFTPIHRVGHSIYVYHLSEHDVGAVLPDLEGRPN